MAKDLHLHPLVSELLCQRGFSTVALAQQFLEPRLQALTDPFLLTDLRRAVERLLEAINKKQRIVIFGDYDVDGITSSALLWRVLKRLGAEVESFLPLRIEEGYGLSQEGVERCVEQHHPDILVAVDCGTTAVDQVAWLRARGISVLIVDHHALPPALPSAHALVNPQRDGFHTNLASVGLVFKVCHGLLKLLPKDDRIDLREYLDLVALGTVADIVPLTDENRVFVRRGLRQIEQTTNVGIKALVAVSRVTFPATEHDVGFRLGPRLNASGRLGDAMLSLRLLQTDDWNEAQQLAKTLDENNSARQNVEASTFLEAEKQMEEVYDAEKDFGLVLCGQFWHWGVIGIVASRLQKRCYRPTVVIGIDENGLGKGSARSIEGVSVISAIAACSKYLEGYGGHAMAAGLTIRAERIDSFREAFNDEIRSHTSPDTFHQTLNIAGSISLHELEESLYRQLEQLAPYGRENPEPVFLFEDLKYVRPVRLFGRNHVKLVFQSPTMPIEAVGFGLGKYNWSRAPSKLAGTLEWDDYRERVQIRIVDWLAG